ncbi:hypothetical protein J416_02154 [Gracilibacillus halophilus YIM-C55.5]|uniref:Uncharacterized protein n=1 Tax=Gracilibacillus halophilus YIM-C55.5 TaxID=1308866 RepID=N4WCL2_9BACI|nr:hypothetical protein [Gracilibacillus halophilus]ENH98008.1 hypothetical protein J416_02154 [Gracilibacillus halophilus YIM-C55.5]
MKAMVQLCIVTMVICVGGVLFTSTLVAHEKPTSDQKDNLISIQATDYILAGESSLREAGDDWLTTSCRTRAKVDVNRISCHIFLQYWNSSSSEWRNTGASQEYVSYSSDDVRGYPEFSNLPNGYYYRIQTSHVVRHLGIYESFTSTTSYVLID